MTESSSCLFREQFFLLFWNALKFQILSYALLPVIVGGKPWEWIYKAGVTWIIYSVNDSIATFVTSSRISYRYRIDESK